MYPSVLYEYNIKLINQATAEPSDIFVGLDINNRAVDDAFSFDRTRSRFKEMRKNKSSYERMSAIDMILLL